jgi:hypothetical protein
MGWFVRFWKWLWKVLNTPTPVGPAVTARIVLKRNGIEIVPVMHGGKSMNLLREGEKVSAVVEFMSAAGSPAKVDGVPVWNNSDETVGTLIVAADGLSIEYLALVAGVAQLSMTADADLGEGVRPIVATADIQVEPGEAASARIIFSAVTKQ